MSNQCIRDFPTSDDISPAMIAPVRAVNPASHKATANDDAALVENLLTKTSFELEFPPELETMFQTEVADARTKSFVTFGLWGLIVYNAFLPTDYFMMPDIIGFILIVQLALVTPVALLLLYAIHRRLLKPESGLTFCQLLVLVSICAFYTHSNSEYALLLIFTVPSCMAFGNVVLPLPFRFSLAFTVICVFVSTLAILLRQGDDFTSSAFTILNNTTIGIILMFSTYRSERSERKTYLFNLRERFRGDVLAEKNEQLRNLSETDGLTGVANRRCFDAALERLWQDAADAGEPLSLFFVDIDHFKRLNDTFGHHEGDHCLKAVAQCLQTHLMPNAVLARYGGEEFVVLLPGVNELYGRACAEVLRSAVSRLELTSENGLPVAVTVSIGIAAMVPHATDRSAALLHAADQALYRAKGNGRNRIESAAAFYEMGVPDTVQYAI